MIKYSVIPSTRAEDVTKFLLGSFFVEEPLGQALGLSVSQVERWLSTYIAYAVNHSVSVMAVESDTNTLVGVCVCIILDPSSPPTVTMPGLIDNENEATMAQIARILSTNWANNPNPPEEKALIHLFLNVDTGNAGKGIAKQLIDQVEARAVEKDVHLTMVDTTSQFSYRAYEKQGYKVIREVEYTTIEDGVGIKPLEAKVDALGVHTHLRLLSKAI